MKEVISIFKQIQNTSSLNEKRKIITANKDNDLFKSCLVFLLDGNIVTGISDKKLKKKVGAMRGSVGSFEELMTYLMANNSGKDTDITVVQDFLSKQDECDREFYSQMITKKFRLGADAKVVNKCIPGLISTWDVQQAYPISDKNEPKDGEWFALSQKLNGINNAFVDGKHVSRQGKVFTGMDHVTDDINRLSTELNYVTNDINKPSFKDMFFNGELIRKNHDNLPDDENFQIGTGIINSDDEDKTCIKFVIYEMFPKEEFLAGESEFTYKQRRRKYLVPLAKEIAALGLENIEVVPVIYEGTNKSKIQEYLEMADNNGWEGLMLNKNTTWKNKRNNGILKVKSFKNADIRCTDVVEGDGKYKGTLGLIKCNYKGYELGVGSGFTDKQRDYYWNHRDEIVGKIVQIKYKCETKNKKGGISVQFPVFQCVREEGKTESYN